MSIVTERELKMEQRIAELEALVARKDQQLAAQDQWLTEQKHRIAAQDRQLTQMQHQLDRLGELITNAQRARFGQSSEKQKYVPFLGSWANIRSKSTPVYRQKSSKNWSKKQK